MACLFLTYTFLVFDSHMKRSEETLLRVSWLVPVKGLLGPLPGLLE